MDGKDIIIQAAQQVTMLTLAELETTPSRALMKLEESSRHFRKLLALFDPAAEMSDDDKMTAEFEGGMMRPVAMTRADRGTDAMSLLVEEGLGLAQQLMKQKQEERSERLLGRLLRQARDARRDGDPAGAERIEAQALVLFPGVTPPEPDFDEVLNDHALVPA